MTILSNRPSQPASGATRVFFDDFESGNADKWAFTGTGTKAIVVTTAADSTAAHGGTKQLECNWDGGPGTPQTYVGYHPIDYTSEMLVRLWFRYDADVDRKFGAKMLRLGIYPTYSFYCGAQMEPGREPNFPMFAFFEDMNGVTGPSTNGGGFPAGDGNWHKLEIYIKHNTPSNSNGIAKVWIDGNAIINASGLDMRAVDGCWTNITFLSNWSDNGPEWSHDATNHVYFDDVEFFSDKTTGDACTGSMSDASIRVV